MRRPATSSAALSLLDLVLDSGSRDPLLWYATGRAYEVAGSLERAERCYLRGIEVEREGASSAGHYYLGVLYSRQGRWQQVVDTLEFLARGPISPPLESAAVCGLCARADWPAAVLLLADGYARVGQDRRCDRFVSAVPARRRGLPRMAGQPRAGGSCGARRSRRRDRRGGAAFRRRHRSHARLSRLVPGSVPGRHLETTAESRRRCRRGGERRYGCGPQPPWPPNRRRAARVPGCCSP